MKMESNLGCRNANHPRNAAMGCAMNIDWIDNVCNKLLPYRLIGSLPKALLYVSNGRDCIDMTVVDQEMYRQSSATGIYCMERRPSVYTNGMGPRVNIAVPRQGRKHQTTTWPT